MRILKCWLLLLLMHSSAYADLMNDLQHLKKAYPNHIQSISEKEIVWKDNTVMLVDQNPLTITWEEKLNNPSLRDQIENINYPQGILTNYQPLSDPGRIRYEPFFKKMYGENEEEIKNNLVTIYWMPHVFGERYPLQVTKINDVDKKLMQVSDELEKLPPQYYKYLQNPTGAFYWRTIAHTDRISTHSYGIAIDLNLLYTSYWQWDLTKAGFPVTEQATLSYHNQLPWEIIQIFEKHGFIWGGKWYHYDTMHFEYRPELLK